VVEEDTVFGVFCRRWGVPLIDGGTVRLPRLVGMSRALDMILTGRAVGALEAYEMGLANRVVAPGESLTAAGELAAEIARFPQVTMRNDRASVYAQDGRSLDEALSREFALGQVSLAGARDGAERFAAGRGRHGRFDEI
jgi:enoyl-CoA hydratase